MALNSVKQYGPTLTTNAASSQQTIWLCLDFPLLGMECHHHYKSDRAGGLIEQHRLLAVNAEGQDSGIEEGMSIGTVESLCPQLVFYPLHQQQQEQVMQKLALWAWRFSPVVVIKKQSLLLEVGSCLKLFKGLRKLMHELEKGLLQQGYTVHCGLAHTPKAAEHATRLSTPWQHLLSNDFTLDSAALNSLLGQLPLQQLPFKTKILQSLEASGLFTLSQLRQLPSASLSKRFGQDFSRYLEQLWGKQADPQPLYQPPPAFEISEFFLEPIENQQHLMPVMQAMLKQLCRYLSLQQLHSQQLLWTLHQNESRKQQLDIRFSVSQNKLETFIDLSDLKLSQQPPEKPVHTLSLTCTEFTAINEQADDLFEQNTANGSLADLQDKLRVRLGDDALYQLEFCASHIPEFSGKKTLFKHAAQTSKKNATKTLASPITPDTEALKLRPSWLLRSPAALQTKQGELFWQGPITLLGKPERIGGYWWQTTVSRDYFIARGEQGQLYWVFQNKRNQRWFLHGFFG